MSTSRWWTPPARRGAISLLLAWVCSALLLLYAPLHAADQRPSATCQPTPSDALGPFYEPEAPERSKVGEGYVLQGMVRSADDCQPLADAVIEFWLAGPNGRYGDAYRARVSSDKMGRYTFESHVPVSYSGRPPHIHIRVTAAGHRALVTQHYPATDQQRATFDLVLRPHQP